MYVVSLKAEGSIYLKQQPVRPFCCQADDMFHTSL